jgi:hypothetical protein
VCKCKDETSRNGGKGDKGEWWRRWIKLSCTWYIVRTLVNVTMYPYTA